MDSAKLNYLFGTYLTCSYAYYKKDISLIPDTEYDRLCTILLKNFDKITHRFKLIVRPEDFEAGTGFAIIYPEPVERSILWYIDQWEKKQNDTASTNISA